MPAVRAVSLSILPLLAALAAQAAPGAQDGAASAPTPTALAVGAMQIASDANLQVESVDVNVAADKIVYSYFLKNSGAVDLDLTASVVLPELRASQDDEETWTLAGDDPENPVALAVAADGAPVATTAELRVAALGLDRLAEVKGAQLPLIPFGGAADKALAGLAPETAEHLAALGVVSPRDPADPRAAPTADWALNVTRTWRQALPAGKITSIGVTFAPIKAEYRLGKGDGDAIADATDDLCLSAQTLAALQARLASGGALDAMEFAIDVSAPARWIDSPPATINVKKPKAESVVAFCGMDEKSAGKPIVIGALPDDASATQLSVVVFTPAAK
ncbi:MAG: DUF4424 family protein [Roseiarcus sp.]